MNTLNTKFFHSVYLDESLCKGCINCIKRCPTQAIRVRNGKVSSALTAANVYVPAVIMPRKSI